MSCLNCRRRERRADWKEGEREYLSTIELEKLIVPCEISELLGERSMNNWIGGGSDLAREVFFAHSRNRNTKRIQTRRPPESQKASRVKRGDEFIFDSDCTSEDCMEGIHCA